MQRNSISSYWATWTFECYWPRTEYAVESDATCAVSSKVMWHCPLFFSDRATNPSNRQEDWEYIMGFCDQINKELEGYGHIHSINSISLITSCPTHLCPSLWWTHGAYCEASYNPASELSLLLLSLRWNVSLCFLFIFSSAQISVRLLAHKIQSPQEWEAMQALTVCSVIISLSFSLLLHSSKIIMYTCFPCVGPRGLYEELRARVPQWSREI